MGDGADAPGFCVEGTWNRLIELCFTEPDGDYRVARWGRPIVPVVFGVEDATLAVIKGAIEAVVALAGHKMAETDPELGANCMVFFFRDWQELLEVPDLERLIPDLKPLVERLVSVDTPTGWPNTGLNNQPFILPPNQSKK